MGLFGGGSLSKDQKAEAAALSKAVDAATTPRGATPLDREFEAHDSVLFPLPHTSRKHS